MCSCCSILLLVDLFLCYLSRLIPQRKTYKTEVEKLTLRGAEWEREKKEREILQKKYETAKKKLGETVSHLDEARTANRHYQQQVGEG